jgi:hypothetical protein
MAEAIQPINAMRADDGCYWNHPPSRWLDSLRTDVLE